METKYTFEITAKVGDEILTLYRKEYYINIVFFPGIVLHHCKFNLPFAKWVLDDGDDEANKDNYILAIWSKNDLF